MNTQHPETEKPQKKNLELFPGWTGIALLKPGFADYIYLLFIYHYFRWVGEMAQ